MTERTVENVEIPTVRTRRIQTAFQRSSSHPMLSINGISAAIFVDGRPLDEYGGQINHHNDSCDCYVASEPGKAFQVRWFRNEDDRGYPLSSFLYLDGDESSRMRQLSLNGRAEVLYSGVRAGENHRRPFIFKELKTTGESAISFRNLN